MPKAKVIRVKPKPEEKDEKDKRIVTYSQLVNTIVASGHGMYYTPHWIRAFVIGFILVLIVGGVFACFGK